MFMRRAFLQLVHSLPTPAGMRLDRTLRVSGVKRAQFVSYLESSGYRTRHIDRYERNLRNKRYAKTILFWMTAFAVAWVVLESAKALSVF
jgi:hypothetical protein